MISGCRAKTRRKSHGAGLTTGDFNTMEGRHRQDVETPVCSKLQIDDTGEPVVPQALPRAYPYMAMNSPRFLSLASMWVSTN